MPAAAVHRNHASSLAAAAARLLALYAACPTPPTQPIARGSWSCSGAATLQSGDACAATCNPSFIGSLQLPCTASGVYALIPMQQCRYNNSELWWTLWAAFACAAGACASCMGVNATDTLLKPLHRGHDVAGAGLQELFMVVEGPLQGFPPLSDDTLATLAGQIAGRLELPAPYSSSSLITWFESATLSTADGQRMLSAVVATWLFPRRPCRCRLPPWQPRRLSERRWWTLPMGCRPRLAL